MPPLVTVVILSYARPEPLRRAIESVAQQSYPGLDILVIDNRSAQSSAIARVVSTFPRVRFIANEANLGFTGGMNVGIAAAAGELVYLTEDDVSLRPGCLGAMVDYIERHRDAALVAPVMYDQSSGAVRSAGGRFVLDPVFSLKIITRRVSGQGHAPFDVMYVPGASILARTALLRKMNGFRQDFFLYQEDLELCIRVLKSGHRIVTVPEAGVDHIDPPVGPASDTVEFFRMRNLFATYLLHAPARVLPAFLARYGLINLSRTVVTNPRRAWLMTRAWLSVAAMTPALLRERDSRSIPLQPREARSRVEHDGWAVEAEPVNLQSEPQKPGR
jgi:GT2 family glycosyltransferase